MKKLSIILTLCAVFQAHAYINWPFSQKPKQDAFVKPYFIEIENSSDSLITAPISFSDGSNTAFVLKPGEEVKKRYMSPIAGGKVTVHAVAGPAIGSSSSVNVQKKLRRNKDIDLNVINNGPRKSRTIKLRWD